jgi:hypothetical protein
MKQLASKFLFTIAAAAAAACALPTAASAQIFYNDLVVERGPIEPGDAIVGEPLPGANPAELRAGLIWNMRAGLNNAALQCQFSPYLRAVDNYNALLAHHSEELAVAYRALEAYFRRTGGAQGQRKFDQWSTLTYNKFATLQGQSAFCQTAGDIAKEALAVRKGGFYDVARNRMRELRASQRIVQPDRLFVPGMTLRPLPATAFGPVCTGLTGRALQQCQAQ